MAAMEAPGAVILLEARGRRGTEPPAEVLGDARALLEAHGNDWVPGTGGGLSGSLTMRAPADAFAFVHDLRTRLRVSGAEARVHLAVGFGIGDELVAARLAGEAFRGLGRKGRFLTRALTPDADSNVVLGALTRTLDTLLKGWTDAQWEAISHRDRGRTLQQIGSELGIAYQNVSKRLIAARYGLYREVLEAASLVFVRAGTV